VRKLAEARDWTQAMRLIDEEAAWHPDDVEVREWRARVLTWSGRTEEAEREWNEVLRVAPKDPDNWLGLASVYQREGRFSDAQRAIDAAVELDPRRADLHVARGRILRAGKNAREAKLEFEQALQLDPSNVEAKAGLDSVRGEPKHALRIGEENDTFNFADANHEEWIELGSRWTPHWGTELETSFYQRGGTGAGKFLGSVTGRSSRWGAFTVGGAAGHDNLVIPKSEAFFDLDHGFRISETRWIRGVEIAYGQHWYWYEGARILTLNQTTTLYLPSEWSWSLRVTGARSHFSGTSEEWKPSGMAKLSFPLAHWASQSVSGSTFFAVGTENFAQIDQIGSFASRSYGGELRFQFSARQDIRAYSYYQKRTQDRTQTSFGFSYGIRF
jgi:tetratricopeptide (TPR) repeat protein